MADDYNLQLITQKPINYNGLLFYPISFGYICDNIGLETFDKLLMPFLITKDCLNIEEDKLESLSLFNDIIMTDEAMLYSFASILQVFCKCDSVVKQGSSIILQFIEKKEVSEKKCVETNTSLRLIDFIRKFISKFKRKKDVEVDIPKVDEIVSKTFVIDENNFEDICQIIMKMNGKGKIKVEKPPKNMSERQRDVWEKLQAGRKRENEKNTVHIYDMLNVCEFGGHYHIPIEEIEGWTLWKIMNCYKARVNMKTYDDSLKICLVSGDGKSISDKNHWHHKLMVRDE